MPRSPIRQLRYDIDRITFALHMRSIRKECNKYPITCPEGVSSRCVLWNDVTCPTTLRRNFERKGLRIAAKYILNQLNRIKGVYCHLESGRITPAVMDDKTAAQIALRAKTFGEYVHALTRLTPLLHPQHPSIRYIVLLMKNQSLGVQPSCYEIKHRLERMLDETLVE